MVTYRGSCNRYVFKMNASLPGSDDEFEDFNLTDEDWKLIKEQEAMLLLATQQPYFPQTTIMSTSDQSTFKLQKELEVLKTQVTQFQIDLENIRKEKLTKEGEATILRQKINSYETEKYETSLRHAKKLEALEQEKNRLIQHWQREVERLQTELKFKENEVKTSIITRTIGESHTINSTTNTAMNFSGFVEGFEELISTKTTTTESIRGNKRPKAGLISSITSKTDASCEAKLIKDMNNLDVNSFIDDKLNEEGLRANLAIALSKADTNWCELDFTGADTEVAREMRSLIWKIATVMDSCMLALDAVYTIVLQRKRNVIPYYVQTVIEWFVDSHFGIAQMLFEGIPPFGIQENIKKMTLWKGIKELPNWIKDTPPTECNIVQNICQWFTKQCPGKSRLLIHGNLRTIKNILWIANGQNDSKKSHLFSIQPKTFDAILTMFEDGSMMKQWMLAFDQKIGTILMKQFAFPRPLDCSFLNCLNQVLHDWIWEWDYTIPCRWEIQVIMITLYDLVRKRILPATVTFEPATLRMICRRISQIVLHNFGEKPLQGPSEHFVDDLASYLQVIKHIAVNERAPFVELVLREIIPLIQALRTISSLPLLYMGEVIPLVEALNPILENHLADIINGKYLPSMEFPIFKDREKSLTEEEELAWYENAIEQQRLQENVFGS